MRINHIHCRLRTFPQMQQGFEALKKQLRLDMKSTKENVLKGACVHLSGLMRECQRLREHIDTLEKARDLTIQHMADDELYSHQNVFPKISLSCVTKQIQCECSCSIPAQRDEEQKYEGAPYFTWIVQRLSIPAVIINRFSTIETYSISFTQVVGQAASLSELLEGRGAKELMELISSIDLFSNTTHRSLGVVSLRRGSVEIVCTMDLHQIHNDLLTSIDGEILVCLHLIS